jgi:alginate O-acetyltransferase complex protein AlgI
MSFTSPVFAVFVAVVFVLYYAFPHRVWQTTLLVVASIYFYASDQIQLLPVLLAAVLITYLTMRAAAEGQATLAAVGIVANLLLLGFFKYKFLFIDPDQWKTGGTGWINYLMLLPLPIGISFFVFHNISAIVDYYRFRKERQVPTLIELTLYILFFPQLVSGPITRAASFLPQVRCMVLADVPFLEAGKLLIFGYFMKLYVANNINEFTAWMAPETMGRLGGGDRVLMVFLYSCQIYADFFGYSTIALGLALLFGYRLPVNFKLPYTAHSFSDFWNRWHISLSTWLRVYLYIPLGGNRISPVRTYLNLMTVMGLGGLWHGASWNYLLWGLVHGLLLAGERFLVGDRIQSTAEKYIQTVVVFLAVSFAWLLFRFKQVGDAATFVSGIRDGRFVFASEIYLAAMMSAAPVVLQHMFPVNRYPAVFRALEPAMYGVMLWLAIFARGPETVFIYFRF